VNERSGARSEPIPALLLTLGMLGSAFIIGASAVRIANSRATITVTGSAKQQIRSDMVVWRGAFHAQSPQMQAAYTELKASNARVHDYLIGKGIPASQLVFSAISTQNLYQSSRERGVESSTIIGYRLSQTVEVRSQEVDKITGISRESTELIQQGVAFESYPPEYLYTKLADLKVEMVAKATRDAKSRAEEMAKNSGSRIGRLRSARMGVFQITPAFSTAISDYGVNDTSSLLKDITAVVTAGFEIL
jgi:hypothetical protein